MSKGAVFFLDWKNKLRLFSLNAKLNGRGIVDTPSIGIVIHVSGAERLVFLKLAWFNFVTINTNIIEDVAKVDYLYQRLSKNRFMNSIPKVIPYFLVIVYIVYLFCENWDKLSLLKIFALSFAILLMLYFAFMTITGKYIDFRDEDQEYKEVVD